MGNIWKMKAAIVMVVVQIAMAGLNIFYELAASKGMSLSVLVAYRFLFAAAFIVPHALYLERNTRPKLTWTVAFQAFLCGLSGGTMSQNLYAKSLALTSAAFASALSNLIPSITFIMAIFFGLESLGLKTLAGKAKVLGTLMGLGGAMLLTLYNGVEIDIWSTHVDLIHKNRHVAASGLESNYQVLGALLMLIGCSSFSLSLIIQSKMSDVYPCHYSSTALMAVMGSIQAVGFALCAERDWNQWRLGWDIRLLTVAYSGIVGSGIAVALTMWCVHERGPVFVSVFSPLMLVMVAIAGSLILGEKLHLGSTWDISNYTGKREGEKEDSPTNANQELWRL